MEAILNQLSATPPSEFINLKGVEYFRFEEDFMENSMRCIPMIIRFKMDKAGIKLKLSEWRRFRPEERIELALMSCNNNEEIKKYNTYLTLLVKKYMGRGPKVLETNKILSWDRLNSLPEMFKEKLKEFEWNLPIEEWQSLTDLQRFALLKLCRPGHKNRNFPKAMKEFGLIN